MIITIVSTYPANGSKNIGDLLLTSKTAQLLRDLPTTTKKNAKIEILWREDTSQAAIDLIKKSSIIVYACLAIRPNMKSIYPLLESVISSKAQVIILASGTSLPVEDCDSTLPHSLPSSDEGIFSIHAEDAQLIRRLEQKSIVFTTRDVFTQELLSRQGIPSLHTGDIAFLDDLSHWGAWDDQAHIPSPDQPIIISDPHYPKIFLQAFRSATESLSRIYGSDSILIALHGVNPIIKDFAISQGLRFSEIFTKGAEGLNVYKQASLHFGFRVHAHVSALVRAKPSYLLEIDGRGSSYAMTIPVSCSRQCYRPCKPTKTNPSRRLADRAFAKAKITLKTIIGINNCGGFDASRDAHQAPASSVQQLLALMNADEKESFSRFKAMEDYLAQLHRKFEFVSAKIDSSMKML